MRAAVLAGLAILVLSRPAAGEAPDEASALRGLAAAHDPKAEYHAGLELGRMRSVPGLERLVERRSREGIGGYMNGMAVSTSTRDEALAPEAEALIVRNFDDPELGRLLQALVARAKYRTRSLFELFRQRLARPDLAPEQRNELAAYICRTDLPVEEELLAILRGFPDGKQWLRGRTLLYVCLRGCDTGSSRVSARCRRTR